MQFVINIKGKKDDWLSSGTGCQEIIKSLPVDFQNSAGKYPGLHDF